MQDFDALWSFDDPAGTEARLRALLPGAEDVSYRVQLLTQIARTQGLQRRFEEAHRWLDEASALLGGRDLPEARVRLLLERGRAFDSPVHPPELKRTEEARRLFEEAFEYGRSHGQEAYALDAAHMLALVEPAERQVEWGLRALAVASSSADERARKWQGPLLNNLGWTFHDLGRYDEALSMFRRSEEYRRSRGEEQPLRIARWAVARCLRSLGQVSEALSQQRALLADYESAGVEEAGYVSEEIAECLLALERAEEARPWFARAFSRLSASQAWMLEEEAGRMERLRGLGGG